MNTHNNYNSLGDCQLRNLNKVILSKWLSALPKIYLKYCTSSIIVLEKFLWSDNTELSDSTIAKLCTSILLEMSREKQFVTKRHFVLLRLKQESCISRRLWCHFTNFLQRGNTNHSLKVHYFLWDHSIIEEKKMLLYSWHLPKSPPAGCAPSVTSLSSVV